MARLRCGIGCWELSRQRFSAFSVLEHPQPQQEKQQRQGQRAPSPPLLPFRLALSHVLTPFRPPSYRPYPLQKMGIRGPVSGF